MKKKKKTPLSPQTQGKWSVFFDKDLSLGELYKEFNRNNNTFVAPTDYIEGNSSLLFIVNLFYHLSSGSSFKDSFAIASTIDSETKLYNFYS